MGTRACLKLHRGVGVEIKDLEKLNAEKIRRNILHSLRAFLMIATCCTYGRNELSGDKGGQLHATEK